MTALITEVTDGIYEIRPEGNSVEIWPLCTVYLVVDEKVALVDAGLSKQAPDITQAVEQLITDLNKVSYIILTHAHPDHVGGAGLLAQNLPQAQVVAHQEAAKFLIDDSLLAMFKEGFKMVFGNDAEERFGEVYRVAEERFQFIDDGVSVNLGSRELRAIHTPGHDPYHFCFLDTMSDGLFCADALGGYLPEQNLVVPPIMLGTHFIKTLQTIEELCKLNPKILLFPHGGATKDDGKYLEMAANNLQTCTNIALTGLKAEESKERIASMTLDALAESAKVPRDEISDLWDFLITGVDVYYHFFKKRNMI